MLGSACLVPIGRAAANAKAEPVRPRHTQTIDELTTPRITVTAAPPKKRLRLDRTRPHG